MKTSSLLTFEGLSNTRDLGGMESADGVIKEGLLFRSGQLFFGSMQDVKDLSQLNIRKVFDFRSAKEREEKPDPDLKSGENVHIPIIKDVAAGISRDKKSDKMAFDMVIQNVIADPEFGKRYMMDLYLQMVQDPFALSQYSRFLKEVYSLEEGAVLWHCTAGKDRAGFASVLIEEILDVPKDSIYADYLSTNVHLEGEIQQILNMLSSKMDLQGHEETVRDFFGAREEYLHSLYAYADEHYGSMDGFIENALGVTAEMKEAFKERYL